MKTIGLLGGMSWESTELYYRRINEGVRERLGGLHSARVLLHSVDFAEIAKLQAENRWSQAGEVLASAALGLQKSGADMVLICTNLMHKVAPQIEQELDIPLLHIADAAGRAIKAQNLQRIGLLGASYTMEEGFYRERLAEKFGLEVIIPEDEEREDVHRVIFEELCRGIFTDASKQRYLEIIKSMRTKGAEGVVLGCTEIPLLIKSQDIDLPLFNTAVLHAEAALIDAFSA